MRIQHISLLHLLPATFGSFNEESVISRNISFEGRIFKFVILNSVTRWYLINWMNDLVALSSNFFIFSKLWKWLVDYCRQRLRTLIQWYCNSTLHTRVHSRNLLSERATIICHHDKQRMAQFRDTLWDLMGWLLKFTKLFHMQSRLPELYVLK